MKREELKTQLTETKAEYLHGPSNLKDEELAKLVCGPFDQEEQRFRQEIVSSVELKTHTREKDEKKLFVNLE